MRTSITKRISISYAAVAAVVVAIFFLLVFQIVRWSLFSGTDERLNSETINHLAHVRFNSEKPYIADIEPRNEGSPTGFANEQFYVQLNDANGRPVYRSGNLEQRYLIHNEDYQDRERYTAYFNKGYVRQLRIPIMHAGQPRGHVIAAIPIDNLYAMIDNVLWVMLITYPLMIFILFATSKYLAAASIRQITLLKEKAEAIRRRNFNDRVPLPNSRDEAYELSVTINDLLQQVEDAQHREKQFSSYVSHELRTPISVLRGTLEVLIRKPRRTEEYESRISECLREIDRLTDVLEQLMVLARADGSALFSSDKRVPILDIVHQIVASKGLEAELFNVDVRVIDRLGQVRFVPEKHVELILGNLIGNAIKYGAGGEDVVIEIEGKGNAIFCSVKDNGQGIGEEEFAQIFKPFYRSESINKDFFNGTGLGLSIAQKAAYAIGADIHVSSKLGKGSVFTLVINEFPTTRKSTAVIEDVTFG